MSGLRPLYPQSTAVMLQRSETTRWANIGHSAIHSITASARASSDDDTEIRSVVAKVEWHPGELCPRVGFVVTNLSRSAERVVAFYNHRGTAEQWIKEGKGAIKWTRLSCRAFAANAVRLQLHAVAYNLGNSVPKTVEPWSLTSLARS